MAYGYAEFQKLVEFANSKCVIRRVPPIIKGAIERCWRDLYINHGHILINITDHQNHNNANGISTISLALIPLNQTSSIAESMNEAIGDRHVLLISCIFVETTHFFLRTLKVTISIRNAPIISTTLLTIPGISPLSSPFLLLLIACHIFNLLTNCTIDITLVSHLEAYALIFSYLQHCRLYVPALNQIRS